MIGATLAGFPWLQIAGKLLAGWLVIDLDAMLITAHRQGGAAATWKKGYDLSTGGVGGEYARVPGDAAAPRERRLGATRGRTG